MDQHIQTFLEKLDLTHNEIKIYHASLDLGESTVTALARHAGIHRVAAYALVENLLQKGLLTRADSSHGQVIAPTSPRSIKTLLQDKRRSVRKLELKYEEILPDLLSIYQHTSSRPRVQFYEGIKGLEQMNWDVTTTMLDFPEDQRIIYSYSNPNAIHERFEEYVYGEGGDVDQRKQYHIFNRAIAKDGPVTRDAQKRNKEELREMIIVPEHLFPFKNDITIYAHKIAIQAWQKDIVGVVIENQEIVEDQLAIFQLAWEGAKVFSKK